MSRQYIRRMPGDEIGEGKAVLIRRLDSRIWGMRCQCGMIFYGQPSESKGFCRACAYDYVAAKKLKHGESPDIGKKATRLYCTWTNMRARCNNKNNKAYACYGGRGIAVCKEWDDYCAFKKWAENNGYSDELSIDRIDVNGNYCPENCRWVDQEAQMQNVRTNIKIGGISLAKWCRDHGVNYDCAKNYRRNHPEMSIEDIVSRYLPGR